MNSDNWNDTNTFRLPKKIVQTFSWSFLIFRIQIDLIVITNYWIKHKNWPSLKCHRTHCRDKKECLDFSFRYGAICYLKWLKHENVIEKSFFAIMIPCAYKLKISVSWAIVILPRKVCTFNSFFLLSLSIYGTSLENWKQHKNVLHRKQRIYTN